MDQTEIEDVIVHKLARRMYLRYCEANGKRPFRQPGYAPPWALDYAEVAVDFLGYDEDMVPAVVPA